LGISGVVLTAKGINNGQDGNNLNDTSNSALEVQLRISPLRWVGAIYYNYCIRQLQAVKTRVSKSPKQQSWILLVIVGEPSWISSTSSKYLIKLPPNNVLCANEESKQDIHPEHGQWHKIKRSTQKIIKKD
jgi:hypothetical protein